MSIWVGLLLLTVSLSGAFVLVIIGINLYQLRHNPDLAWEYLVAILLGVALLVWPVVKGASIAAADTEKLRDFLDIKNLESYRLVNPETQEELEISLDTATKRYLVTPTQPPKEAPPGEDGGDESDDGEEGEDTGEEVLSLEPPSPTPPVE